MNTTITTQPSNPITGDYACPVCKADVGPPKKPGATKCTACGARIVPIWSIGVDVTHLIYCSKR